VASFYLDTSALVKRYAIEPGTSWIVGLTNPAAAHLLYTVHLTAAEMIAALYRKVRTGEIDARQARQAEAAFRADWAWQYEIGEATEAVVERAMTLARRYPLRGYDALHLAAALEIDNVAQGAGLAPLTLLSADGQLLAAATSEGLAVGDPNRHQ
jgi:predicted nucleic acid-binding protein